MRRARLATALLLAAAALLAPAAAVAKGPRIEARAWDLVDARTGRVLASHALSRRLPIASTTKLMTAWVVLHELPPRRIVRASPYHPTYGESLLNLRAGQRISVRDLLYGLVLRSGNDAAYDLARAAAGSERRFVHQMNLHAAALGLSNTHYANPIGLDQRGNYSSAGDLATLTARLLRIPLFARIAAARQARLDSVRPRRRIATINELLHMAPWVTGVKTGHTFGALYVIVGSARREGVSLIAVVIGAPSDEARFGGAMKLLEYGFSRYRRRVPVHAGQDVSDAAIRYSGGSLPLRASRSVAAGTFPGQAVSLDVKAEGEVEGPVPRGKILGRVTVLVDGRPAGSTALRAGRSIPAATLLDRARSFVTERTMIAVLAPFVILIAGALAWRARRRRRGGGVGPSGGLAE